jgi:energy-coupling factor transporter ATP-binding protein EcfA2
MVLGYSFNINLLKEAFKILLPLILIISIFLISYKLLWLRDWKCHKTEIQIVKNPELPIRSYEDINEISKNFVNSKILEIKNIINNENYNNATIAVIGRWGTGKSSILKILEEQLNKEKEKYKVLYLDLISFYSSEQLYFNLIKALGLEFNYPYWKNLFLNYEVGLSSAGFDFKFLIDDPVNFEERLNHFKEHITKSLGSKKIILILDELDRLTDQQAILNVFKFINAFGRIKNLYLIAPIDRTAFLDIFEKEYLVAGYLDKTFDFKVEVHPPLDLLKELFFEEITRFIHKKDKNIFLTELEKKIFDEEFETILYRSSIFNFDSFRDVIKLREQINQLIKFDLLGKNIFLLDLILIEWLKYKHPLIWESLMNEHLLFCYKVDLQRELLKGEELTDVSIQRSFSDKDLNERIENFVDKLKDLLSNDPFLLKSVTELILYLIDIEFEGYQPGTLIKERAEVKDIFLEKTEKILKIKPSIYITTNRLNTFFTNFSRTEGEFKKEINKETKNALKFKRLFRLHNLKIYLGAQDYLIKIDDKKFKTLPEIIDCFENKREEFEEKIINDYTKDLYKIPDGNLISIRNSFLEEILIDIISYIDAYYLRIIKDIYKKIEDKIEKEKDKIGIKNAEVVKESLKEIYNDLHQVEEYFK